MKTCFTLQELRHFLEGCLPEDSTIQMEKHLEQCSHCQQQVERLLADSPLFPEEAVSEASTVNGKWNEGLRDRLSDQVQEIVKTNPLNERPALPFRLGEYQLLEILGEGGMGIVYQARQGRLNRLVALKMIRRSRIGKRSQIRRFSVEAEAAASLDHPGIVPIFDVGEVGPYLFYTMQFVCGGTLAQKLKSGPLPPTEAARILLEIAKAIQFAHEHGVIHRDLKPSNILIESDGKPRVADFGLAKQIHSEDDFTVSGEILGTPSYMPPEQAQGQFSRVSVLSDLYALGAILYHMITGQPPFQGSDPVQTLFKVVHHDPVEPRQLEANIPADLETITLKCLAKSPESRYPSVAELIKELNRFLHGNPIHARPMTYYERTTRWLARNPALTSMGVSIVTVLLLGIIISLYFGNLAYSRSKRLQVINKELIVTEAKARASAEQALEQSKLAQEQTYAAMRILEKMLFELQNTIAMDPSAQEKRRVLLKSVLEELDHIASKNIAPERILLSQATATLGLADVANQARNESGQSGTTVSKKLYLESISMFERLLGDFPDDEYAQESLAVAKLSFGHTQRIAGDNQSSKKHFWDAHQLLKVLFEKTEEPRMSLLLAQTETSYGEILMYLGDRPEAKQFLDRSIKRLEGLLESEIDPKTTDFEYALVLRKLGDWYRFEKQYEESKFYYLRANHLFERQAADYPNDVLRQLEYGTTFERLGVLTSLLKDHHAAREYYIQDLQILRQIVASAPKNDEYRWHLSFSYQHMADVNLKLNELNLAMVSARQGIEIRRKLVEIDPENFRRHVKLIHMLKTQATIYRKLSVFPQAAECYRECLEVTTKYEKHTGDQRLTKQKPWLESQLTLCIAQDTDKITNK
ncbi:Hypothetical protein PBC10988_39350 [Planctomycetales bacterium 10988]|nr:Hypothetical protein PBC10988_39350 [Planctomycetales bacterium 10988]